MPVDYEVPLKYGVDQCIGDTLGPGGVFRGLRHIPVLADIARDMEEVARPGAIMLQYANPMAANCLALGRITKVPLVGLCHGVQTTLDLIAGYCGIADKHEITYTCGGINHMDWFLRLEHEGRDLYPELREKFERPEYYKNEKVRGEVFRHFGYFMTESTGHLSEYVPWFRKNRRALDLYCDEPAFGGESGAYYKWGKAMAEKYAQVDPARVRGHGVRLPQRRVLLLDHGGRRHGPTLPVHGQRLQRRLHRQPAARLLRRGADFADDTGPATGPCRRTAAAVRGRCMTNVNVQQLTADAALTGDPEHIVHALALDPLTAAVCTLKRDPRHGHRDARGPAPLVTCFSTERESPRDP